MLAILSTIGNGAANVLGHISPAVWRVIGIVAGVMLIFWVGYSMGARHTKARIEGAITSAVIERAADDAAAAVDISSDLRASEIQRGENVREVIREVPVLIRDNRECDLPADVIKRLNEVAR